jgi:hypothetical protein
LVCDQGDIYNTPRTARENTDVLAVSGLVDAKIEHRGDLSRLAHRCIEWPTLGTTAKSN